MSRTARFFISRIVKNGVLGVDQVLDALRESISTETQKYAWTIVEVHESELSFHNKKYRYLSGSLVKYDPDGTVEIIDETIRAVRSQAEPNMQRAASLFVYFPDEAIFGHKQVWNDITSRDFRVQVADIITGYHRDFFVECELNPVVDMSRFLTRLGFLKEVRELKANVSPPNPLYGIYWKDLKKYLTERNLRQLAIREKAKPGKPIPSAVPVIARQIEGEPDRIAKPAPIGDAAILMAADGYGTAEVIGKNENEKEIVIKTSENALQLKLDADISAAELAKSVVQEITRLNKSRMMKHK